MKNQIVQSWNVLIFKLKLAANLLGFSLLQTLPIKILRGV